MLGVLADVTCNVSFVARKLPGSISSITRLIITCNPTVDYEKSNGEQVVIGILDFSAIRDGIIKSCVVTRSGSSCKCSMECASLVEIAGRVATMIRYLMVFILLKNSNGLFTP